ncbi:MAG: F0F1 ATP synthase subunit B [Streptosporangiaceae bacterium]
MTPFAANDLAANNFLIPNGTFFAELLAFLIILAVLWRYVVPPVQRIMQQRQEAIRKQLEEGQAATKRLEEAEAEYERALSEARHEASRLREEAQQQRRQIVDQAADEARAKGDEILRRAEEQITAERQRAMTQLRDELGRLAVELAGRVVGESLQDDARQNRVVERFLSDLERAPEGPETGERERVH